MKRATALRYSVELARRVHSVNGILSTPGCSHDAVRVSRMWVFGSTAKGSDAPNDLDVLIELKECGRHYTWRQARLDRRYFRAHGIRCAIESREDFLKWLTKGMRLVSRHCADSEGAVLDVKKLIYPRYEMDLT